MEIKHVEGKDRGNVMLYALSTCGWCKKAKSFFKELDIAYCYIDVDLLEGPEKEEIVAVVKRLNPRGSYPTIIIGEDKCIVGFDEAKLRAALGEE
jgi:glutaredoxin